MKEYRLILNGRFFKVQSKHWWGWKTIFSSPSHTQAKAALKVMRRS